MFLFVIVTYFLLRRNYVIYSLGVVTLLDDVRITLDLGTFELPTKITLQSYHFSVTFICNQKNDEKITSLLRIDR